MKLRISSYSAVLVTLMIFMTGFRSEDQTLAPQEIKWVSIEEAVRLASQDGKKILVDVYTDWCGWCKRMDAATYKDPAVVSYISENFHAVRFNAEKGPSVTINEKTYKLVQNGRKSYHELAVQLLNGRLQYPNTVFLTSDFARIYTIPGYIDANKFSTILSYTAEEAYKKMPFPQYDKQDKTN